MNKVQLILIEMTSRSHNPMLNEQETGDVAPTPQPNDQSQLDQSTKELQHQELDPKQQKDVRHLLEVNMCYCFAFTACWGFSVFQTTFSLVSNTNTTPIFEAKFGWDKDETILNNSIISAAAIVGLTIGSFLGGAIIPKGRR